jgi:hypothetical protein
VRDQVQTKLIDEAAFPHFGLFPDPLECSYSHTANEGLVRIQYKCLVPIYVFLEMKLRGLVISKTELKCSVSQFPYSCSCSQTCRPILEVYKSLTEKLM